MNRKVRSLHSLRNLMIVFTMLAASAGAQMRTVWQIGKFDDSSREFHDAFGVDYANLSSDVNFVVGTSDGKDWLRFQPGSANGQAGARLHPFTIRFTLAHKPQGTYALKVAILYETPRLSALRVDVNGRFGMFHFSPRLDYAAGDWEGTFVPQTSHAERLIDLPAAWLHQGENVIVLTAMDDPDTPENSSGDIAPGVSGIVYDALSLQQDSVAPYPTGKISATANATIFFTQQGNSFREQVQACVDTNGGQPLPTKIEWKSSTYTAEQPLNFTGAAFGESCATFSVPEWQGVLAAHLRVKDEVFPVQLQAQKKWTMLVVPLEHLDVGFTDYREKVAELQSDSIDGVLDLLPKHPEFRWTMDGSWVADQYLRGRSPERQKDFLDAIRAGKIVLPLQYANEHTGVASLEGLTRSFYFSSNLARKFNLPIGAANITDVPSYSWSYASILHDAGVKYFAAASNSWRAPLILEGRWNEKSPFYWEGPDGGRVLMWYSRAYLQLASMFGTPPDIAAVKDALPVFLQAYERKGYRASSVILYGSQLENTPLDRGQLAFPAEWTKRFAYPRLQFATFKSAMSAIETQFDGAIPTYRGDFGPYWEDGFTSDARSTALHRANQQRFLNAEVMATIPSLENTNLRPDASLLRHAWKNSILFDEHTWTSVSSTTMPEGDETVRQTASKRAMPVRASQDLTYSIERSFAQLDSMLAPKNSSIVVFNALNWPRSGWLQADVPEGDQLVDAATGKPVPQESLYFESGTPLPGFGGKTLRVRYRAENVPAVGYKLLAVVKAHANPANLTTSREEVRGNTIENRFYRVTLDAESGSIRSIWDKQLKRELVEKNSPYRFGSYLYVTGADDMPNNSLYRYGAGLPLPHLTVHPERSGRIISIRHGVDEVSATLEASDVNTPRIQTVITLPTNEKRIDITVSFTKKATLHREAVYIAFPMAMQQEAFAYDTQNGWVDPAINELAGGSREWYATQHWAAVHNGAWSAAVVPFDAPMITFGDIVRGAWPKTFSPQSSTIFSWLMSNYWSTNFMSSQGGDYVFRYSFVSASKFEPEKLTQFGWERLTPLESDPVNASFQPSPVTSASFLAIDNPNVVLTTWKRAEDGNGSIVRLTNISGQSQALHLTTPHLQLEHVQRCTLLENCSGELTVDAAGASLTIQPFAILTLRVQTQPQKE